MAAARANWKGYLRLSLVSCPIALYPATSESEKIRFNQLNKTTGNRLRYSKVDAETGEEVDSEDIIKGYQVSKGHYIEVTDEDLEAVTVESTRTIDARRLPAVEPRAGMAATPPTIPAHTGPARRLASCRAGHFSCKGLPSL